MTAGEYILEKVEIALIVLAICCGIAMCLIAYTRARAACDRTDAYCEYLDRKFGWSDLHD